MENQFEFIVLGSGIAGLIFALKVAPSGRVAIITKKDSAESNTNYAQGGIASVVGPDDDLESHIRDTLEAGAGLCHEDVVRMIVSEGPQAVQDLIHFGVEFSHNPGGQFDLGREGGHSHRRVLHAGDLTGQVIERALLHSVRNHPNIKVFEHHFAIDLLTTRKLNREPNQPNRCLGVYALDVKGKQVKTFTAGVTILATGGAGKVYLYTSNPDIATGDGFAMAWRAGAKIANLEFVQFHPTCLYNPGNASAEGGSASGGKSFLLSEALRGEGGLLRLNTGETFMERYDSRAELAPRDVVARAIDYEMKKRGDDYVLLDMTHLPKDFILQRFPNISERVQQYGYDITAQPIPVVPAAHYMCGGVMVNSQGETTLRNLFGCGEVTFTGFHGGNRLASNSLLEAVVYANHVAREASNRLDEKIPLGSEIPPWNPGNAVDMDEAVVIKQNWDEIRQLMWNYVGIVRSNKRLIRAKKRIELLKEEIQEYYFNFFVTPDLLELRNIASVADLIIQSAMWRKESRGLHYNIDYPSPSELYRRDTILEP